MQDLVILLGVFALGLVVGYLVQFSIKRFGVLDVKALLGIIGAITSGVIAGFLRTKPDWAFGVYLIGVFGGLLVIPILLILVDRFIGSNK
jgi:hypothetical protein